MRSIGVLGLVLGLGLASAGFAEPYLAAWKGVNCNACHVNQTGGWMRDDFGKNYGNSLQTFDWQGLTKAQPLSHPTATYVATGLDLHVNYFYNGLFTTEYTSVHPPALLPVISDVRLGRESFSVYAHSNEIISGVVDYRVDNSAKSEMYGLISQLPADGYLKIGAFNPAYGLGLSDDDSLVRGPLGFTYDTVLNGLEAGFYPDNFFVNAAVFDDALSPLEKMECLKAGFHFSEFTLGGSFFGKDLDTPAYQLRYDGFGWARFAPFVLLAEADQGNDGGGQTYQAYHASLETDLGNDVYLRLASEYLDHGVKIGTEGFRHLVSLRCYPVRNLKFQVDLARLDYTSSASPNKGNPGYSMLLDTYFFY
ncbi:MAG TPA: hypothetical protein VMU88_02540 [bacterium]|nr:hypothetical protein [bacterium]